MRWQLPWKVRPAPRSDRRRNARAAFRPPRQHLWEKRALFLRRGALDRRRRADLDPPRLRLLRLLHVHLEDTVVVVRRDVPVGDALRYGERAAEDAVASLEPMEALLGLLLGTLALARDGHGAVVELHR